MDQLKVSTTAGGRVALLTPSRPERMNALSSRLLEALERAIAEAEASSDKRERTSAFLAKRQPTFHGRYP